MRPASRPPSSRGLTLAGPSPTSRGTTAGPRPNPPQASGPPQKSAVQADSASANTSYDVVFYNKWGSVTHHTFPTLKEAKAFADEYRNGVYSLEDGVIKKIEINRVAAAKDSPGTGPQKPAGSGKIGSDAPSRELGWLSKRYEVGKGGPETISSGKGDKGGVSYGTYQLSSKEGTVQRFVNQFYPQEFKGLKPATPAFNAKWKQLADTQGEAFQQKQHLFIKQTHYDPAAARVRRDLGLDVNSRGPALQNVLWSTAVQSGPGGAPRLVNKALAGLVKQKAIADINDAEIINAIYDERGRTDADGNLVHFKSSSKGVQDSVTRRYRRERQDALDALTKEQKAPSVNPPPFVPLP
jgi:hypothetical protein